jgi:hypothetical protein
MEKPAKKVKKVAKKSLMNTSKPKEQADKRVPAIPVDVSTGWREEEELVDYELIRAPAVLFATCRRYFGAWRQPTHSYTWASRQFFS